MQGPYYPSHGREHLPFIGQNRCHSAFFLHRFLQGNFAVRCPGEALDGPQVVKVKPGDATLVAGKLCMSDIRDIPTIYDL